jgi:hypothetical protein
MESQVDAKGDINALRSLILSAVGSANWYDAAPQSLETIYTAVHASGVNVALQGQLSVVGNGYFSSSLEVAGDELLLDAGSHIKVVDLGGANAGQIIYPDAAGQFTQSSDLVFDATNSLSVGAKWSAKVSDGSMSAANGDFIVAADGALSIATDKATISALGAAHFSGDFDVATSKFTVNATSGDTVMDGTLRVNGNNILSSDGSSVMTFIVEPGGSAVNSAQVEHDLTVVGNLTVQGTTTYVDTTHLKVSDAFIHVAVGSTGMGDSGIVLHTGGDDLIVGRNADDSEFIFAAKDVEAAVDSSNAIEMAGINLVKGWMSGLKVADVQGSADLGQFKWETVIGGGHNYAIVDSAADLQLVATQDMFLESNSSAFKFNSASSSQNLAAFEALYGAGTTLIGALMAAGAAGSNRKTGVISVGTALTAGGSFDYSSVGALRSADYATANAKMDIYVNGVKQAVSLDFSVNSDSGALSFTFDLVEGDVVIVTLLNAAL